MNRVRLSVALKWVARLGVALVVSLVLATPGLASAQEAQEGDKVVYKKKTSIDFSDTLIEGDLMKPEGTYVVSRKASKFSTLIRLREHFIQELLASPNQL